MSRRAADMAEQDGKAAERWPSCGCCGGAFAWGVEEDGELCSVCQQGEHSADDEDYQPVIPLHIGMMMVELLLAADDDALYHEPADIKVGFAHYVFRGKVLSGYHYFKERCADQWGLVTFPEPYTSG